MFPAIINLIRMQNDTRNSGAIDITSFCLTLLIAKIKVIVKTPKNKMAGRAAPNAGNI